jgi:hypothetical protein
VDNGYLFFIYYLPSRLSILYLLRSMWRNTSCGDTCNSGVCITDVLNKPKPYACLVPKLPRNPQWPSQPVSLSIWNEVFIPSTEPLCFLTSNSSLWLHWSFALSFHLPPKTWLLYGFCIILGVFFCKAFYKAIFLLEIYFYLLFSTFLFIDSL